MGQTKPNIEYQNRVVTDKYEIYLLEELLLCVHYFENTMVEAEDIAEAIKIGRRLSPSDETKLLVEVDRYVDFTAEARQFAQNSMRILKAEAHVFPSLSNKIMFNFFIKFRKNNHPLRAFSTVDNALSWLAKF